MPTLLQMNRTVSSSGKTVVGAADSADFERECVAFFGDVVRVLGIPRSLGQIYGLLYSSPVPLGFTDIVGRLAISKGSASQGLRWLRSIGAVKVADREIMWQGTNGSPAIEPGARIAAIRPRIDAGSSSRGLRIPAPPGSVRIAYEPELGLRKLIDAVLRERLEPMMGTGKTRMGRLRRLAENARDRGQKEFQLERVRQLETWQRQVTMITPVLKSLLLVSRR